MQVDLEELQPKLKEATIATDALLVQIAKDTEVANEKKAVVEQEVRANALLTCSFTFSTYRAIVLKNNTLSARRWFSACRKSFAMRKQRNQEP